LHHRLSGQCERVVQPAAAADKPKVSVYQCFVAYT
jgi:hypothetical protein